jgi:hypothetical protein
MWSRDDRHRNQARALLEAYLLAHGPPESEARHEQMNKLQLLLAPAAGILRLYLLVTASCCQRLCTAPSC